MMLLNKPDQKKFRELYENEGPEAAAMYFCVPLTTAERHARENKIYNKKPVAAEIWTEDRVKKLIELMPHLSHAKIAEILGIGKWQVTSRISAMKKAEKYLRSVNLE